MLTLRLKPGEYLTIGENITVQIFHRKGDSIEVAVEAPKEIPVLRGKLVERTDERPPKKRSENI
ncbi:carbon storage regulator [Acutalibacter sp. 1XD8-36]|uniref:carbon storage regulator n=1 Tax=Acutalibacter sp. 1XD8-36 TaxID=2320852 RepID=UPI0014134614|nr:carbon storage regulator [Acutalibacter sp. 1XD8-36]NBJ90928.1 carbon storage regulator [Acutalibacter sp. 1XD8-36]